MITTTPTPAAAYIRVSSDKQSEGFSPEIQREAIRAFAAQQGYDVLLTAEDVQTGRKVSRKGYQQVLDGVRAGVVHAVIVYMFDRWGRNGGEWVTRAHELERAGVDFLSVQEGREEGGMMRFIRAGMAEQYARDLAKRVRPAMERSARGGQKMGPTQFGYKRVYPERENSSRYVPGLLVPVEPAASIVRELFRRYAAGGWTLRTLVHWMNTNPACPPSPKGKKWTIGAVRFILRNPEYAGRVRYNRTRLGFYDTSAPGSEFVVKGRHEALITQELFDQVQARLDAARRHDVRSRLNRPLPLAAGLFFCAECGSPMTIARRRDDAHKQAAYTCRLTHAGVTPRHSSAYLCAVAHDGLLAQIGRLQGHPWQPQALDRVLDAHPGIEERAELQRALNAATADLQRHIRRFTALVEDPTPQEVAAHRAIGREISDRITALEAALAALPAAPTTTTDLAALHAQLTRVDLGELCMERAAAGDESTLRELVTALVAKAVVTDRVPALRSRWVRVAVTWTPDVQLLLDAKSLTLAPDVERPYYPATPRGLQHDRYVRWAARKKASLV